jgi:hypothetical protein
MPQRSAQVREAIEQEAPPLFTKDATASNGWRSSRTADAVPNTLLIVIIELVSSSSQVQTSAPDLLPPRSDRLTDGGALANPT